MIQYCEKWDSIKGNALKINLTHSELFIILGKFAYDMFDISCLSCLEFERCIEKCFQGKDSSKVIVNELLGLGIFSINGGISFAHKTYKEYFAAYYLINTFPLNKNIEKYIILSEKEEWKEVFIFIAGMFKSLEEQDEFLELLLDKNLKLYIECVNAKSDLNNIISKMSQSEYVNRYVKIFMKTYRKIVDKYFSTIKNRFDPIPGLNENEEKKECLVCAFSNDRESIHYLFDRLSQTSPDIKILDESEIADYIKELKHRALMERRNIKIASINLRLSNLMGDSARKVALNKIKNELKDILEKRKLFESDYLLCEKVVSVKNKFQKLWDEENLINIHNYVKDEIQKMVSLSDGIHLDSIMQNNVEMLSFEMLLRYLVNKKIKLSEYILPSMDNYESGGGLVWDMYSQERKLERICKFFYWHQLSYINMVDSNFPKLSNLFRIYQDTPYQTVVYFIQKQSETERFFLEPILYYYHIASNNKNINLPIIRVVDETFSRDYNAMENEIENSYIKQGKKAMHVSVSSAGFTITTTSRKTGGDLPLNDYVYQSIKDELMDIFGKF